MWLSFLMIMYTTAFNPPNAAVHTIPYIVMFSNHKIISLLLHNYNFAAVINNNNVLLYHKYISVFSDCLRRPL